MGKMFDMDNPVWRFMGKVTDMFFLTCLWLLFSLPVVTIGASTCASLLLFHDVSVQQGGLHPGRFCAGV